MSGLDNNIKKILEKKLWKHDFSYFLFGSRVKGDFRKNSDYDVGIKWKKKLELRKYLQLKRLLNDNINYRVDLVDFNRVWKDFSNLALKNIKLWNKWKNIELIEKN